MHCQLQSPERVLFNGEASMVVARSQEGEFAVMDKHAPFIATLEACPLRIKTEEDEQVFAINSGVIQVTETGVTILAQQAVPASDIDLEEVRAMSTELEHDNERADETGYAIKKEKAFLDVQEKIGETFG